MRSLFLFLIAAVGLAPWPSDGEPRAPLSLGVAATSAYEAPRSAELPAAPGPDAIAERAEEDDDEDDATSQSGALAALHALVPPETRRQHLPLAPAYATTRFHAGDVEIRGPPVLLPISQG